MPDRYDGDFIHAADPHIESGHRADAIGLFRLIALLFRARRFGEKACPVSMVSGQNPSQQVSLHCTCFVICAPTRAAQPTCTCYSSHTAVSTNRKSNTCNDISVPSFLPQLYVDEKSNDWLNDRSDSRLAQNRRSGDHYMCNDCRRETELPPPALGF